MAKVLYEKRDRIAYVTINRPEARNAIDPDVHRLMIETWADFRDDDSVDVAILTGAGDDAFSAGADLKTYIPPIMQGARPGEDARDRRAGPQRLHARDAPDLQADHRRGQRLGAGGRPRDRARLRHPDRLRARDVRVASRRGAAFTTATAASCGSSTPAASGVALADAAHRRADRRRARARVRPGLEGRAPREADRGGRDGRAPDPAQLPARGALGEADDPRRDRPAARRPASHRGLERLHVRRPRGDAALLGRFYDKSDAGRAGSHETPL